MEERERQRRRQAIRRKRRRRQRRILLGSFALLLSLILGGVIYLYTHPLFLKSDVVKAELNEEFDPTKNVRFVFGGKKSFLFYDGILLGWCNILCNSTLVICARCGAMMWQLWLSHCLAL